MISNGHQNATCRAALRIAGIAILLLLFANCRGGGADDDSAAFIAIHEDVRAAIAAFGKQDKEQLNRALDRLGQLSEQPALMEEAQMISKVGLSRGGRYMVIGLGESLGGSKLLLLDARTGRLILGMRGYGESFSPDDRWLACLQHRYATPKPGGEVGTYEALMLVDLGRVRGASLDDTRVFRTIVQDLEGLLMGGESAFIGHDRIKVTRAKPQLSITYSLDGEPVRKKGRRWKFLKLF